jgi:hypothetical protein
MNVSRSVIQNTSRYKIAEWLTDDDSQHYVRPVEAILYGIEPSVNSFSTSCNAYNEEYDFGNGPKVSSKEFILYDRRSW